MATEFVGFRQYQVTDVTTVAEFFDRYYKPDWATDDDEDRATDLLRSYEQDVIEFGFCWIMHHNSVTGRDVSFYPASDATCS